MDGWMDGGREEGGREEGGREGGRERIEGGREGLINNSLYIVFILSIYGKHI